MVQRVADDHVARACKRREHAEIRHVAGTEQQRGVVAAEQREFRFEIFVQRQVAADQPRTPGRGAVALRGSNGGLDDARISRQVQIVRACEHQDVASADLHARPLHALDAAQIPIQPRLAQRVEFAVREPVQSRTHFAGLGQRRVRFR